LEFIERDFSKSSFFYLTCLRSLKLIGEIGHLFFYTFFYLYMKIDEKYSICFFIREIYLELKVANLEALSYISFEAH